MEEGREQNMEGQEGKDRGERKNEKTLESLLYLKIK